MDFDKLSREQKIKFWEEISSEIENCLHESKDVVSEVTAEYVLEYLSHNELGIALELLADQAIEEDWNISNSVRKKVLGLFRKMNYHITDKENYASYEDWSKKTKL